MAAEADTALISSETAARAVRGAGRGFQALPSGGAREPVSQLLVRLIFAVAVGVIVLEVGSQITGQFFDFNLRTGWQRAKLAGAYVGLYPGQRAPAAATPSPARPARGSGALM